MICGQIEMKHIKRGVHMPLQIICDDITKMKVDAVVNAATNSLLPGGGVCGAIFRASKSFKLIFDCIKIGGCKTGEAVITKGYRLPAKYIIHTPGPKYKGGRRGESGLLYSCYYSSLELAKEYDLKSIAFPLISTGIYGYPKNEAVEIAKRAIMDFLKKNGNDMEIYLVMYKKH